MHLAEVDLLGLAVGVGERGLEDGPVRELDGDVFAAVVVVVDAVRSLGSR